MNSKIQKHINENCQYLSYENILQLEKHDNGPINNVINRLEKHSYGIWLLDDNLNENYFLFYINGGSEISGLRYRLNINNSLRNEMTFAFSKIVNDEYPTDTDILEIFNTFQHHTRTVLEKLNYYTYGNEIAGISGILIAKDKVGIEHIPFFEKTEAFKSIYKEIHNQKIDVENKENWIYLMHNPRNGYTKIGRSINPKKREKTLQGEDPQTEIIAFWKVPRLVESELHRKYETKRIRGEWFNLTISDLITIREYMKERLQ